MLKITEVFNFTPGVLMVCYLLAFDADQPFPDGLRRSSPCLVVDKLFTGWLAATYQNFQFRNSLRPQCTS
jgi:hypothetical protein